MQGHLSSRVSRLTGTVPPIRSHHRLVLAAGVVAVAIAAGGTATATTTRPHSTTTRTAAASTSGCPGATATLPASGDGYRSSAGNTTFDGSKANWTQKSGSVDYSLELNYTGGGANCLNGLVLKGTNPSSATWSHLKACCDAAGVFARGSLAVSGVRMDNVSVDDFRLLNGDGNDTYDISGSHLTNTRDDCFSTAHGALTVTDTLAECYSVVSWRHTGHDDKPFPVTLNNDLLYLKPAMSGSENHCPSQMSGGLGSGQIWKMDGFGGSTDLVHVTNTVFRADQGNDMACQLAWAKGTYSNDTMVWTGKGAYPGHLPAGVTLTTNKSVWDNAVSAWQSNHPGM